jgi:predicted nucleotidyltransferase
MRFQTSASKSFTASGKEIRMDTEQVAVVRRWAGDSERWLAGFLEKAPSDGSIVSIIVMGSAVRERGHRRSDFDLLLIYRGRRPVIKAPMEVDVRFLSIEQIDDKIAKGHEILGWALKFGVALYDPQGNWEQLQASWRDRVPLPSAIEAGDRGRQALERAIEMLHIGDESAADDLALAALTQFARERLIKNHVFPASRPELPDQLRGTDGDDLLARLLDDAMYGDPSPSELISALKEMQSDCRREMNRY